MGNLIIKHSVPRVTMIKGIYYLSISIKLFSKIINLRYLIFTDLSKVVFLLWILFVIRVSCLSLLYCLVCSLYLMGKC